MSSPILTFCSARIAFLFFRAAGVLCQIYLLIQAHSFLARSHTARHASTFSSEGAAATCSASSSTARSSFLQKGNCACGDGCKSAFDGTGETERRGVEQETKSAERTASTSKSIIPPGPPPLPAPAIPQGAVWAAEEGARAFPYPQRPSAHTTPVC